MMRIFKLFSVVAVVLIVGLISCESNREAENGTQYTLAVPEGYVSESIQVFITGESGELLDAAYWEPGDNRNVKVYAPEDFSGKVNFHYAIRMDAPTLPFQGHVVRTVADVEPGEVISWQLYPAFTHHPKSHRLTVHGIPTDQYNKVWHIGPSATPQSDFVNTADQTFFTPLLPGPLLYIFESLDNTVAPRYLHLPDAQPDQSQTVIFTAFVPAERTDVTLSEQVDHATLQIHGMFPGTQPQFVYTSEVDNTEIFALYYFPESIVPDFRTYITLNKNDQQYYYTRHGGKVSALTLPDMEVNSIAFNDNVLSADVSGSYDSLYINGGIGWNSDGQEYVLWWDVVLDDPATSVTLPDLSPILRERWPELEIPEVQFFTVQMVRIVNGANREEWRMSQNFELGRK